MTNVESWILSYLLNSLWQVPLLLAAGWMAARLLRRAGALAEHRVWVCVLVLQSLLPACSTLSWQWLRNLIARLAGSRGVADASVTVVMGSGTGLGGHNFSAMLLTVAAAAYVLVSAYFAARFLWSWFRLLSIRRAAVPVELTGEAALVWQRCSQRFRIEDASIAASSQVFGPVTMGLSRRLVLLPAKMLAGLPESDLYTVIAHEFAHIRRNDFLINLLYEVLSLPVSYHPLFWFTRERIMETREMVCDQMAAEFAGPNEYARSLLRLASLLLEGMPVRVPHAIGIFDANALERRLMKLTEKRNEIRGARRLAIVATCALLGAGICGSALALSMHVSAVSTANDSHPSAPGRINVSPGVMAGNKLSGPAPQYPEDAKKARIQGKVVLNAVIGKDGAIEQLNVLSGPKELQQSSLDAVRQWTYKPYLLNGEPVEVETTINVIYTLAK
ncbi:TonB family protein [Silvibacterium bohemicum]|uniref:TonB family protein n=1 Tax=Silvibacterium bohemicum TaxID=1577686 RepID=A0A841JSF7_9BACT|nr:TonB family protein [Silvibacterium bohemicum]MBB6143447.1 TonB family protein [Silvibacterium bohemicum]